MTSLTRRSEWPLLSGPLLTDFFNEDRFFDSPWLSAQSIPAVNVKENEKDYEVEVAAPGFNKKDFNVTIEDSCLTISAEREEKKEQKEDNYTRREFGSTSFSRSFNLPENIREDDIKAHYEDGVLKLSLTKKESSQVKSRKSIDIK